MQNTTQSCALRLLPACASRSPRAPRAKATTAMATTSSMTNMEIPSIQTAAKGTTSAPPFWAPLPAEFLATRLAAELAGLWRLSREPLAEPTSATSWDVDKPRAAAFPSLCPSNKKKSLAALFFV